MKPDMWWKNFGLGMELDASGTFIYNGLKSFDELEGLNHAVDIFEVLYNLSIGIERLFKVAIILIEHNDSVSIEVFEESLMTHNTMDLANRVNNHIELNYSGVHKEFLSLLSKFYKTHRYGRFSFSSVPNIDAEKTLFLEYIHKHLNINIDDQGPFSYIHNTDQIKRFLGKIVKRISGTLFDIIDNKARGLNIYTYELRSDSKAIKIFWGLGDRLDFLDETQVKRELIMFLLDKKSSGDHLELLRSFGSLDLDADSVPLHIKALLNDIHLPLVQGEVEQAYDEISNVKERFEMLGIMDNEHLSYGED
ncbi:hypothetical protein [Halomonas sp.]|uniref:hypothetical protein n=1 Tax=Halomonas sp. TaxID=1486246 RepID=UPI000C90069F|nr:hypothetical protein [Halomonas sp.]MAR72042.1 hypothetical protein [Halomonas sp.]|tara:strand:+ start:5111 stop:6031 length:921 start_codon:yes stop_codon:yes gene_type:complete